MPCCGLTTMFGSCKCCLVGIAHLVGVYLSLKILSFVTPSCTTCFFSSVVHLIVCLFIANLTFEFTKRKFLDEKVDSYAKAILITGCDSGFGHHLAKRLDKRGYHVFASCLFPNGQGAQELKEKCTKKLQILGLDVTKDESVKEAFEFVKNNLGSSELWAVVNNAGIQKGFTTDFASIQDFKDTMEVNGFGMVRVTKAFLPLLKESKGRVVNITSFNGEFAVPHNTPYCMSKFAAAGFSDSLRLELVDWGIKVIQIEPELFQTNIIDLDEMEKRLNAEMNSIDKEVRDDYGDKYFQQYKAAVKFLITKYSTPKVHRVINDLESAVCSKYPAIIYKPGRNDFIPIIISLVELLPYRLRDLLVRLSTSYGVAFPKPAKACSF